MKTVNCTVSSPLQEKLNALESLHGQFSVYTLCEELDVLRGTFYNHIFRNRRGNTIAAKRREKLKVQIQKIHDDSEQIYAAGKSQQYCQIKGLRPEKNTFLN